VGECVKEEGDELMLAIDAVKHVLRPLALAEYLTILEFGVVGV